MIMGPVQLLGDLLEKPHKFQILILIVIYCGLKHSEVMLGQGLLILKAKLPKCQFRVKKLDHIHLYVQ